MPSEESGFELGTDGPSVILVGVDDSTTSIRAGWYAAGLARRQGARIVAVFVSPLALLGATGPTGAAVRRARRGVPCHGRRPGTTCAGDRHRARHLHHVP